MKLFDSVPMPRIKRNKFDLSFERKMTLNMGYCYPALVLETLPGDKFRVKSDIFLRFLAMLAPVMHRVDVSMHYFFVPNRLVWKNWPDFITGGRDGLQAPVMPQFRVQDVVTVGANSIKESSLLDYMGFPVIKASDTYNTGYNSSANQFNALSLRAYQLICDQFYRNQNTTASPLTATFDSDGVMSVADLTVALTLQPRCWQKDYLTSCLPWTQRGGAVSIPISSTITSPAGNTNIPIVRVSGGAANTASHAIGSKAADGSLMDQTSLAGVYLDPNGSLVASSSSLTVNALRQSLRLQEWLEKNARGGGRYIEQIAAHFGVVSSDARLQRVEYLGGGKAPVVISEVLQHSASNTQPTPLATMAGHAMSIGTTNQFTKFFEEHGHVIGILSVMPRTGYQQMHNRAIFGRIVNTDYYFPSFAHLGEQNVWNAEAYCNWADVSAIAGQWSTFGYQSRYAEYKYKQDEVCGAFRNSLAYWSMNRVFSSQPSLNTAFVQAGSSVRTDWCAVGTPGDDRLVCQIMHQIDALRPIPYFSQPRT